MHDRGACVAGGHAWQGGCMVGRAWGCAWQGICIAGGMHGMGTCGMGCMLGSGVCMAEFMHGGCAWQDGMCGRGACIAGRHAWQEVCMEGRGACVAGETATAVDGTHPTGMHSCNQDINHHGRHASPYDVPSLSEYKLHVATINRTVKLIFSL